MSNLPTTGIPLEEFLGHTAFRDITSKRFPPGDITYASWIRYSDGTDYLVRHGKVSLNRESIQDALAREISTNYCHRCAYRWAYGVITSDGNYKPYYSTTQKKGQENRWGKLCLHCRTELGLIAKQKYKAELQRLGFFDDDVDLE